MTDKTPLTVIGLGPMGQAMVTRFLEAGHPTTVWNRTPARADAVVARGAVRAATAADAVAMICGNAVVRIPTSSTRFTVAFAASSSGRYAAPTALRVHWREARRSAPRGTGPRD